MAVSSRQLALKRLTVGTGVASLVAGAAIYLQVSGFTAALGQLAASIQASDPGAGPAAAGGDGGQVQAAPPVNPGGGFGQQPVAVSGGS